MVISKYNKGYRTILGNLCFDTVLFSPGMDPPPPGGKKTPKLDKTFLPEMEVK